MREVGLGFGAQMKEFTGESDLLVSFSVCFEEALLQFEVVIQPTYVTLLYLMS